MRKVCHLAGTLFLYVGFVVLLGTIVAVGAAVCSGHTDMVEQLHRAVPTTPAVFLMGSCVFGIFAIISRMLRRG